MDSSERIGRMKLALAAAEAVEVEIERRNGDDINPFRIAQRQPILQRAAIEIRDTKRKIRNLEASLLGIALDPAAVGRLDQHAQRLDDAIRTNALIDLTIASLTVILNSVGEVRTTLA